MHQGVLEEDPVKGDDDVTIMIVAIPAIATTVVREVRGEIASPMTVALVACHPVLHVLTLRKVGMVTAVIPLTNMLPDVLHESG